MSIQIEGKLYAVTGTLKSMTRAEATERLKERGAIISKSVSSKTDYLVAGAGAGSKLEKARVRGVVVLNEKQFLALLKGELGEAVEALQTPERVIEEVDLNEALRGFRELGYDTPGKETWARICELLEKCPAEALEMAMDYLAPRMETWPTHIEISDYHYSYYRPRNPEDEWRVAPYAWTEKILLGQDSPRYAAARVLSHVGMNLTGKVAQNIAACRSLTNLTGLFLNRNKLPGTFIKALADADFLSTLTHIDLSQNNIGKTGARHFGAATNLGELRVLGLSRNKITDAGAVDLARASWPELRWLMLAENAIADAGAAAIASSNWSKLENLTLENNNISDPGAFALAEASWPELSVLRLGQNPIGGAGLKALSDAPNMGKLKSFIASHNSFSASEASGGLFSSGNLKGLQHINIESRDLGDVGAIALSLAAPLPHLDRLDIYSSNITAEGARALFESRGLSQASEIVLNYNRLGDEGVAAIASATHWKRLTRLHLRDNHLTSAAVEALARARHLKTLTGLYLDGNRGLDDGALHALASATFLTRLEAIDMSSGRFSEEALWAFLGAPQFKKLKRCVIPRPESYSEKLLLTLGERFGRQRW